MVREYDEVIINQKTRMRIFYASMFVFGLLIGLTITTRIANECDCKDSGINWSVDDGFYINFYDGEILVGDRNESYDISMMTLLTMQLDNELSDYIIENQTEDVYGLDDTNMIAYLSSNYWFIGNSSEVSATFNPFIDINDRIDLMIINSSTVLDGKRDTVYIDPTFITTILVMSICRDGYFYTLGMFQFFNFTTMYELIESDITIKDCGFLNIDIRGIAVDINYDIPFELYLVINGEPVTLELMIT